MPGLMYYYNKSYSQDIFTSLLYKYMPLYSCSVDIIYAKKMSLIIYLCVRYNPFVNFLLRWIQFICDKNDIVFVRWCQLVLKSIFSARYRFSVCDGEKHGKKKQPSVLGRIFFDFLSIQFFACILL